MKSKLSSKGQITVPVAVQRALGMRPGTEVEFELCAPDGVLLKKRRPEVDPVDQAYGILKLDQSTDEILRELRGPKLSELPPPTQKRRTGPGRRR